MPARAPKVAKQLNISLSRIEDFLNSKGFEVKIKPTTKIDDKQYDLLLQEFSQDVSDKANIKEAIDSNRKEREINISSFEKDPVEVKEKKLVVDEKLVKEEGVGQAPVDEQIKEKEKEALINHDLLEEKLEQRKDDLNNDLTVSIKKEGQDEKNDERKDVDETKKTLKGPILTGEKIDLSKFEKKKEKVASSSQTLKKEGKKKRKRIFKDHNKNNKSQKKQSPEIDNVKIQKKIAETLDKLTNKGKSSSVKFRKQKREERREKALEEQKIADQEKSILKVTEFVTVGELASMMNVNPNEVISSCMTLGIMVAMNQRLDAETLSIVAEEFGFQVEFVSADVQESIVEEEDDESKLSKRAPIVTIMGHVDHGKTSLLDYIRKENVIAGESGGITQHIGAYEVTLADDRKITFIDTPGHEAFTAMRARGAQVTDLAIIVIAVDDDVMPQTKEAISHAQAANVPIVFAFNKIDKPNSSSDKLKEQLSSMNLLVEDWGGKYQSHDISAKTGQGIDELLEKVLLESDLLELKANPERNASGTIIEASLDKGKGYVATILVQNGTLKKGDFILAGQYTGKVKAMFDERGNLLNQAGPACPTAILGLNGAPQAGDGFNVMSEEKEAKQIATKRNQLQREQSIRTQKHITLDEIGRRLAIGDFKELNIIVKADVDGSIQALSDSFLKLTSDQIQVNVIHKGVGQITDSDVLLASASNAIIIGFQVRPSVSARKLADKESIDIRMYSVIYDAINAVKDALDGMHEPELKEEIIGNVEIREVFKIPKVGSIAGSYVTDGKIERNSEIRLIRDGIVIYSGKLASLKRFKEDVKEVSKNYECGLNIENFNDIKVGDVIEAFNQVKS